ncbi:MAG TPA: thiamine phosphate synthase [Bryocella sp.]|nr:thiamine phosphate synthase [Bryocella sp.]
MLRCAITDGQYLAGGAGRWTKARVDFIQLRAKTLEAGALAHLGRSILHEIAATKDARTRLLINGRADVAVAIGAAGVHLTAHEDELTPEQVRALYDHAGLAAPIVSVSCHTLEEVTRARDNKADLILFGPVFEKRIDGQVVTHGVGLSVLADACKLAKPVPVLALGGVTRQNADDCIAAGAAGIAGIRMFA